MGRSASDQLRSQRCTAHHLQCLAVPHTQVARTRFNPSPDKPARTRSIWAVAMLY
jgi:hypothetical protein